MSVVMRSKLPRPPRRAVAATGGGGGDAVTAVYDDEKPPTQRIERRRTSGRSSERANRRKCDRLSEPRRHGGTNRKTHHQREQQQEQRQRIKDDTINIGNRENTLSHNFGSFTIFWCGGNGINSINWHGFHPQQNFNNMTGWMSRLISSWLLEVRLNHIFSKILRSSSEIFLLGVVGSSCFCMNLFREPPFVFSDTVRRVRRPFEVGC